MKQSRYDGWFIPVLNEDLSINIIGGTFQDESSVYVHFENYNCNFNPLDKVVELYEKMLKEKEEMIQELKALIKKVKRC